MFIKTKIILVHVCLILFSCSGINKKHTTDISVNDTEIAELEDSKVSDIVFPVDEYLKWVQNPENGFRKNKEMAEINFSVQFKPYEYIVCMEERTNEIADSLLKRKRTELEGVQYYDLKISLTEKEGELLKYNLSSSDQYSKRVKYFAFEMQNDIQLVEGNDTLPCVLYHFERTYDTSPSCTILLGFDMNLKSISKQKTLLVYDRTFNKGLLKFTFKENKFLNLPKLQTI